MTKLALATIAAWLAAAVPVAQGHMLPHQQRPDRMTPRQEFRYGVGTARHGARGTIHWTRVVRWFQLHSEYALGNPDPYSQFVARSAYQHARVMVRDHRWLKRFGLRIRAEGWRRMHPKPRYVSSGGVAHRAGWLCIHSREGDWHANTGNGYYGGLQAHYGWGGVARMDLLSPEAQMAVAEREFRKTGYSHAWLAGQWPNTYPPCAGYF